MASRCSYSRRGRDHGRSATGEDMLICPSFTFMFLSLPSGLVLYWTLSNVLQIGQQLYMERSGTPAKPAARAMKKA